MICTDDSIKLELNSQNPIVDYYFDLIEKELAMLQAKRDKERANNQPKPPKRPPPKKRPIN